MTSAEKTSQQSKFPVCTNMRKKHVTVPDRMRQEVIRLVNKEGMNLKEVSKATGVFYPTVKAIQKVYASTGRINKIKQWKQKVKRKPCKRRDTENVYVSSSSEPDSSDFCDASDSHDLPSKSADIDDAPEAATPPRNQVDASNLR